jgi:hypothetical protein
MNSITTVIFATVIVAMINVDITATKSDERVCRAHLVYPILKEKGKKIWGRVNGK